MTNVLIHPLDWGWARASNPNVSSESCRWKGALLRSWCGTSSVMEQPPLDHHYVVMHLGGAKRVTRRGDGSAVSTVVERQALTLVPAGASNVWRTEGPIAFAHLYVSPARVRAVVEQDFDQDGRDVPVIDRVGCNDALMQPLFVAMLDEVRLGNCANTLRLDCLFEQMIQRLARKHSPPRANSSRQALALAPHRLRRVLDFIDDNLGFDITLADLASAAGSSQSHFSRAFHLAIGCSPYHYLIRQRIDRAKVQLLTSAASLDEISIACGFRSHHQFSVMFRRLVGTGPKRYRMGHVPVGSARASVGQPIP